MIKPIIALAAAAVAMASAQPTGASQAHISFTQPVGDGITYEAGTNQTFSWTMACTSPSILVSSTPNATEVDFMDSNNIDNAFYVKKVGTIDCSKSVGNLVWTVPAETKPGVYALQLLLSPNNAYSGRFNVTNSGSGSTGGSGTVTAAAGSNGNAKSGSGASGTGAAPSAASTSVAVGKTMVAVAAGAVLALTL
ncbi:hypothetical protein B0O80DRAFT_426667 [Mortierella sp. GBAus27b]|nr:hypothetical protein BGX31_001551 [Mortierella sp. GBA43]KAI8353824.1 hypothetical protein B0O80DRAFT_426667 [Mortierella sp. GBAus27b]